MESINYNDMVKSQLIKLDDNMELAKDLDFLSINVKEDIGLKVEFDVVFNEFNIILSKTSAQSREKKCIGLSENEAEALIKKLPIAFSLARRYTYKTTSKPVNIPVELVNFPNEYEPKTVLFVKENAYRKGQMNIDIRKCVKREDPQLPYIYTKNGVRLTIDEGKQLSPKLEECLQLIKKSTEITREVLFSAEVVCLEKIIKDLRSEQTCYGCETNKESQDQHMDISGCLREWEETVEDLWEAASPLVNEDDVMRIALLTIDKLPSIKGLVTSVIYPMQVPTDEEKRETILQLETPDNVDNEILATCKLVTDEL